MVQQSIAIRAPIQTVYDTIVDFQSYPEFLPETRSVCVEWCEDQSMEVSFKIALIKEIHYTLLFNFRPPKEVVWKLQRGDLLKKNSGSWKLTSLEPNLTDVVYSLDVALGLWVPKTLTEGLTARNLPETLKRFKKRAEDKYKKTKKKTGHPRV